MAETDTIEVEQADGTTKTYRVEVFEFTREVLAQYQLPVETAEFFERLELEEMLKKKRQVSPGRPRKRTT